MNIKILKSKTKMKLFAFGLLAFIKVKFFPSFDLLVWLFIAMVLDFATGVAKAYVKKENRTSQGFRKTVVKFCQYAGAIVAGVILAATADDNANEATKQLISYLNNGLVSFIIYIEVTSVFENLNEVDKTTVFAKYFYQPALKILTFEIRNNPIAKGGETVKDPVN